jgi:hypothetical protein
LLIGSLGSDGAFALTVTASTAAGSIVLCPSLPDADELRDAILQRIPDGSTTRHPRQAGSGAST